MENQSKVIVIERNKFAALVKSHRKCLQMLNILTYIYTVKEVSLTLTLQEICEVLQHRLRRSGDTANRKDISASRHRKG
mgnify:CR=1 FL=1